MLFHGYLPGIGGSTTWCVLLVSEHLFRPTGRGEIGSCICSFPSWDASLECSFTTACKRLPIHLYKYPSNSLQLRLSRQFFPRLGAFRETPTTPPQCPIQPPVALSPQSFLKGTGRKAPIRMWLASKLVRFKRCHFNDEILKLTWRRCDWAAFRQQSHSPRLRYFRVLSSNVARRRYPRDE
jgi:hypothetical protein